MYLNQYVFMNIEDRELGIIKLKPNARARRIVVRYRDGAFVLTHPPFVSEKEIRKTIELMKPNLQKLKDKAVPQFVFDEATVFQTLSFEVVVKQNALSNVYTNLKDGILSITYPHNIDLESEEFQLYIKSTIEKACRLEANRILPTRVAELAEEYGFIVGDVKINKSRSRWGSCSTKRNINLSYFCMMLPKHLVDFIILHELCHTKEMNHGPRFWALLDSVSNNQSKELTRELKQTKLKW